MKLNYINKIRANISIYANKKTINLLDGTYKSVYKGKSLNFENLREYVINDDVKDIDWKSSARTGSLLVKQFIAEKKHNILFVLDCGKKMSADTNYLENKSKVALYTMGTIGYLAIKNGDYIAMTYSNNEKIIYKPFKYNLYNLEEYLGEYEKYSSIDSLSINDTLKFIYKNIKKKMIIFIITDISGIDSIESKTLKELNTYNDILLINISDNILKDKNLFDVESNRYIPNILLNDKELMNYEKEIKNKLLKKNIKKLKKNNINMTSISSIKQINEKIIKLLKEHKYAGRI